MEFRTIESTSDYEFAYRFLARRGALVGERVGFPNAFAKWLRARLENYYLAFFLPTSSTGERLGIATAYDCFIYEGHCRIELALDVDQALFEEIASRFVARLTRDFPLRKLYCETTTDDPFRASYDRLGFVTEAVLKEYKYEDGAYKDVEMRAFVARRQA